MNDTVAVIDFPPRPVEFVSIPEIVIVSRLLSFTPGKTYLPPAATTLILFAGVTEESVAGEEELAPGELRATVTSDVMMAPGVPPEMLIPTVATG